MKKVTTAIFAESIAAKERFLQDNIGTLEKVIDLIVRAFQSDQKLLVCG